MPLLFPGVRSVWQEFAHLCGQGRSLIACSKMLVLTVDAVAQGSWSARLAILRQIIGMEGRDLTKREIDGLIAYCLSSYKWKSGGEP